MTRSASGRVCTRTPGQISWPEVSATIGYGPSTRSVETTRWKAARARRELGRPRRHALRLLLTRCPDAALGRGPHRDQDVRVPRVRGKALVAPTGGPAGGRPLL